MTELEPRISIKPTGPEKIEESKPITDEEIRVANDLFKRKENKENPLTDNEKILLEKLTEKRKEELNLIFPEFSYEVIYGLKGTSEESERQFVVAKNYFESIIEMGGKSGAIKDFAKRLEKLKNWDISPERVEKSFESVFENRKTEFGRLIKGVKSERRGKFTETEESWNNFLEKAKSGGDIPNEEMARFGKAIEKQRSAVEAYLPEYRREAVIYYPKFAEEWKTSLATANYNNSKRKTLVSRIKGRMGRIQKFEAVKRGIY